MLLRIVQIGDEFHLLYDVDGRLVIRVYTRALMIARLKGQLDEGGL